MVTVISALLMRPELKTQDIKNRLNAGSMLYRGNCLFAQQVASQEAGIPSKPWDIEHSTSQTAESSDLTVQEAVTGIPSQLDHMVQKLPVAKRKTICGS